MALNINVGFIGFGRMGSALAGGAVQANVLNPSRVMAYDVAPAAGKHMVRLKVRRAKTVLDLVRQSRIVFLCLKPQQMPDLLKSFITTSAPKDRKGRLFVSIAAGLPLRFFESHLGREVHCVRVMPNTPALVGEGMSAVSSGKGVTRQELSWVVQILKAVGDCIEISDSKMDAVTALSGSGPAYLFYLAEALLNAGIKQGLSPAESNRLVRQTLLGASKLLSLSSEKPEVLRQNVTSPGGTTAAAISFFDKRKTKQIVVKAVAQAARRSKQLSRFRPIKK